MCLVEGGVYILPRRVGQQHLLGLPHLPTPPPHSLVSPQPAPRRPRRRHSAPRLMGESSTDVIKDTDSSIFRHALSPPTPRFASRRPSPTHPARRAPGRACSASRGAGLTCLDPACVVAGQRGAPASTHATSLSTPLPPPSHPGPTKPSLTIVLQMRHCGPGQSDKDSHTACPHPAPPRPAPPAPPRPAPRVTSPVSAWPSGAAGHLACPATRVSRCVPPHA